MPAPIKCKRGFPVVSSWVHALIEDCDGKFNVWFKDDIKWHAFGYTDSEGQRGFHYDGVPGACCQYARAPAGIFDLAIVWESIGKFVRRFLYQWLPYTIVQPPKFPCAGCATTCGITSSKNPSLFNDNVTFTATITNGDGTLCPTGSVEFFDGAVSLGAGSALTCVGNVATSTFSIATLAVGAHTIKAVFTGTKGFKNVECQLTQTVNDSVTVSCCTNPLPTTLTATITNVAGCACLAGTYTLTWDGSVWRFDGTICTFAGSSITLQCTAGNIWELTFNCQGVGAVTSADAGGTCSPFSQTFTGASGGGALGCCNGTVNVTITA